MKLVEVEWIDAVSDSGWHDLKNFKYRMQKEKVQHFTVGYLLDQNDEFVTVAMGHEVTNGVTDLIHDPFRIPTPAVVNVRELRRR